MKKLRARRKKQAARKRKLKARQAKLSIDEKELSGKIKKARGRSKKRKTDEAREKAADHAEYLASQRGLVRAELRDIKADLGDVNERLRRLARKIKQAAQKRAARNRYYASEHFRYDEFNCREGGPVPGYMYDDLRDLCKRVLEPMRARFGPAHVNSGHRWEFYNRKIGGAPNSYHEYEKRKSQPAADCTFAKGTPAQWAAHAREIGVGGVGQYASFVHVDSGPRRDWSG